LMIDLKNIIVDFDGFKAVDNVNLKVEKNEYNTSGQFFTSTILTKKD